MLKRGEIVKPAFKYIDFFLAREVPNIAFKTNFPFAKTFFLA